MYEEAHVRGIYEQAFEQAVKFAVEGLQAERVMVAFSGNGRLYNLEADSIWTSEPISLSVLRSLVEGGEGKVMVDLLRSSEFNTSVTLAGIISVLFMPIRGRTGEICGFYYLDHRVRKGAFQEKDLKQLEAVVTGSIEPLLVETGACRPMTWDLLMKTCWL
jgi:hypothetical protein